MHGYASLSIAAALALSACSAGDTTAPPVVTQLAVTIDANNDCQLEAARVECAQVASVIKSRYPTSAPRVDVCLDKGTRYEAALEVMNSLSAAGLVLGKFGCEGAG